MLTFNLRSACAYSQSLVYRKQFLSNSCHLISLGNSPNALHIAPHLKVIWYLCILRIRIATQTFFGDNSNEFIINVLTAYSPCGLLLTSTINLNLIKNSSLRRSPICPFHRFHIPFRLFLFIWWILHSSFSSVTFKGTEQEVGPGDIRNIAILWVITERFNVGLCGWGWDNWCLSQSHPRTASSDSLRAALSLNSHQSKGLMMGSNPRR